LIVGPLTGADFIARADRYLLPGLRGLVA